MDGPAKTEDSSWSRLLRKSPNLCREAEGDLSGSGLFRESPNLFGLGNLVRNAISFLIRAYGDIVTLGVLIPRLLHFSSHLQRMQESFGGEFHLTFS